MTEQAVEDDQRRIDLRLLLSLDKLEQQVEQVLPDHVLIIRGHRSLYLDSNVAYLVHERLISCIHALQSLQHRLHDAGASAI